MADTKPATSNGPLRHLNNGIRSLAKKLQPEAPSHERASSLRRSKSVGRVKDLGKSAQGSIEQCKPKKRTRMNLGFDSEGLNETSSVSSIDVPNKRSRPETIVPTTSTNTPSARAATTKSISSTRSNSSPPSKISVGTKEDYDPAKVRFRLSPPDHPSKGVSGPTKETGRIRRAMSLSQARCRTQSPEKNAEKVGGSARNFFANIKDKIISVSGRLPKADAGHWSESFTAFLEDKRACQYFREYLKTEFSEDNLDFAVACRQFRNITDKKKANRKAKFILTTFLKDGAAKWVNLDYKTKAAVKEASDAGVSPNMFRLAQDHIEDLMKNDSYKRFLESPLYAELERVSPPPTRHSAPLPGNTALARQLQLGSQDSPTQMAMSSAGNAAVTRRLQLRSQNGPVQMPVTNDAYNERTLRPRLQSNSFCNLRTSSGCN